MTKLRKELEEKKDKIEAKIIEQVEAELMLASALCDEGDKFIGFTAADGLVSETEIFLANERTLKEIYIKGMNAAGALMSAERLMLGHGLQVLNRELTLVSPVIAKVDDELSATAEKRKATADFNSWVSSLSKWYRAHERTDAGEKDL